MSLIEIIKEQLKQEMKGANDPETKDAFKIALGEMEMAATRSKDGKVSDEECVKILKKLIKSNEETAHLVDDSSLLDKLMKETSLWQKFLPDVLSPDQIAETLAECIEDIKELAEGPAIGFCMKKLKELGDVDVKDVKNFLKGLL